MNQTPNLRDDLPGGDLHAVVVWGLACLLWAVWWRSHGWSARFLRTRGQRIPGFAGRVVLGTLALWIFWGGVGRHLVLETTWPLAVHGFLGALAVEIVLALYGLEKRIVSPVVGKWLTGLRLGTVFAVLTILVQPVFSRQETRQVDRNVVVLLDESESMQQADGQMPVGERLELADYFGITGLGVRPGLSALMTAAGKFAARLDQAGEWVRPPDGVNEAAAKELIAAKRGDLFTLLKEAGDWSRAAEAALETNQEEMRRLTSPLIQLAEQLRRQAGERMQDALRQAAEGVERGEGRKLRAGLRGGAALAASVAAEAAPLVTAVDEKFYESIPAAVREQIRQAAARPRRDLAVEALQRKSERKRSVLEQLGEKYTLKFMQFGRDAVESDGLPLTGPAVGTGQRTRTDLAGVLTKVQQTFPPENLAGLVLLSDMRDNGSRPPDDAARKLGLQGSPICPVVIGSAAAAKDAAIVSVSHASGIFLGDQLRVNVDLKVDGMSGRAVKVRLLREGRTVSEETLEVPMPAWRTSVRLADTPAEKGIFPWSVQIDPVEGEQFAQNNEWNFEAAVSDDRTNVLLIDDRPRWEFRYLRNLFDSRDKSVQLQYVLLHPDRLDGADPLPAIPAAAGRPFGESEATRLPSTAEEWRKFDVIILGDVPPDQIREETWKMIGDCVGNRGAMLVLIAGPNFLPHAFAHETARELIPVKFEPSNGNFNTPPEPAYKFSLTAAGRQSPVFSQSLSGLENARIWEQMPLLRWRHPHGGVKEGASVLAWAQPVAADGQGLEGRRPEGSSAEEDPAAELTRRRTLESKNALVVAAQVALGKVVMLTFDQTWRFRYGIGDTYHHRFWGQLLRWGAGESLPSGTAAVRLGTDQLTYEPGEPVMVKARLRDESFRPLVEGKVTATISRGDKPVRTSVMEYVKDSQGQYAARLEGPTEPGTYSVELSGPDVERLLAKDGLRLVQQPITVGSTGNAVELGDLTVDQETAARVASLSGGVVTRMADLEKVLTKFGPETKLVVEQKETSLWDHWILLTLALTALTAEWLLRRRQTLA